MSPYKSEDIEDALDWIALAEADGAMLFDDREPGSVCPAWRWRGKREDDCADYNTKELAAEMYCATNGIGP